MFKRIHFWLQNARWHSVMQSVLPAVLALVLAAGGKDYHLLYGVLAVFGVFLGHLAANLLDDYFDFYCQSPEAREKLLTEGKLARGMKCAYLTGGQTTPRRLFGVSVFLCAVLVLIGAFLFLRRGWPIALCAGVGAVLLFFYSAPPLRFSFHGLGEIVVGVIFGPIVMCGVAWSAAGEIAPAVWILSIPIGLLVTDILYVHSILDMNPDRQIHKTTLAVLCGTPKKGLIPLAVILLGIYGSAAAAIALGKLSPLYAAVFLTLPLAVVLWRSMVDYAFRPEKKVVRRPWMGPMEFWDLFVEKGLDWFLFRWFLSRNLETAFCLLAIAAAVCVKCGLG
ncbi:MAG: prenyltransferase [Thermoguttaceae bacterium]|nr:prenyltransferase [Thermoguttaceae bacterium]